MKQRFLSILAAVSCFLLLLTASIGLPIYIRPFFHAHIGPYELAQRSGFTETEIREAYDEVMDYLTLPGKDFGTGVMAHSSEGAAHFADCKVLFDLNGGVLLGSGLVLILLAFLRKRGAADEYRLGGRSAFFWAAVLALVAPIVIGGLAALDFDRAFVIFHSIFFPGKSNWLFNPYTDQIILVLPQEFFRNCAILIGAGLVTASSVILALTRKK